MKCPICQNELEMKRRKVGEDANGEAIYNEFAICHPCKKQWNLDKQRAKKAEQRAAAAREAAAKQAAKEAAPDGETKIMEPISREELAKVASKRRPATSEAAAEQPRRRRPMNPEAATEQQARPVRRRPAPQEAVASDLVNLDVEEEVAAPRKRKAIDNSKSADPMFSNIPPKHVREAREKEMRENYQLMLDEDDEDEEEKHPILTAILILLIVALLAVIGFGCYWYFFM